MRYGEKWPFSMCMPSTNSTSIPGRSASSIVTTPSGPTRSSACATAPPIRSSSLAAMVATCMRSSRPVDDPRAAPQLGHHQLRGVLDAAT